MDNDDRQIGRILSRREVLALLGVAGAALLTGCSVGDSGLDSSTNTTPGSASASPHTAPSGTTPIPAATATATTLPACVVSPELTEGPYFVDERLKRSDIRSDPVDNSVKAGVPLHLTLRVWQVRSGGCSALPGAMVDIWHCDALGVYSDVADPGFNTRGQTFLRGYQVTDE